MGDLVDLDAMVEASWRTFQQDFATALGELRPMRYLLASVDDGKNGAGVVLSILALRGVDEVESLIVV